MPIKYTHLSSTLIRFQETVRDYEERFCALHYQLNQTQSENFDLRKALNQSQLANEPAIIQVKQLLLDPAMNKEFTLLKNELESNQAEIRRLQGELDGVSFTQQSKAGRLLMAKCRKLQEENEEMGRELSEGNVHQLETQLGMAKQFADEVYRKFKDLEAHCCALDEEAEDIQQQIFILKNQQTNSRYRERSVSPRRTTPEYREVPESYDRRRPSPPGEGKRRLSEERLGGGRMRDRTVHEEDRELALSRRRFK
eukprot:g8821.t1